MFNIFIGPVSYLLPISAKRFCIFVFLLSIVAFVFPSATPGLLLYHILGLTNYSFFNYSTNYIHCQSRKYVNSYDTNRFFFFLCYFMNALVFVVISLIFIAFITPFIIYDLLNAPWFCCVWFWISGLSYLSFFGYLNKISHRCEYDLPEES